MVNEMKRTHVMLPRELVDDLDRVVGQRRRSEFVAAAVHEKLARENLRAALRETAGSLDLADYPDWETPEKAAAWVRSLRQQDEQVERHGQREPR